MPRLNRRTPNTVKDPIRKLLNGMKGVDEFSSEDMHNILNDTEMWVRQPMPDELMNELSQLGHEIEVRIPIETIARAIIGTGITLRSEEPLPEDLVEHFEQNAIAFVPKALMSILLRGFIPFIWYMDPRLRKPSFRTPDYNLVEFHVYRNVITKAKVVLMWDKELNMYNPMSEIFVVSEPESNGQVDSLARMLLRDFRMLKILEANVFQELSRPAQILLQQRDSNQIDKREIFEEIVNNYKSKFEGNKRKRSAVEVSSLQVNNECYNVLIVDKEYEVVDATKTDMTNKFDKNMSLKKQYHNERMEFMRKIYRAFGLPADSLEDKRREYGNGRKSSDDDFARTILRLHTTIKQCLQKIVRLSMVPFFAKDPAVQEELEVQETQKTAQRILEYLDTAALSKIEVTESYPELAEKVKPPPPTSDDVYEIVKNRIPQVEMNPDRRLDANQLRLVRDGHLLEQDVQQKVEAQALGISDLISDRKNKKQRTLEVGGLSDNGDDDDDDDDDDDGDDDDNNDNEQVANFNQQLSTTSAAPLTIVDNDNDNDDEDDDEDDELTAAERRRLRERRRTVAERRAQALREEEERLARVGA